MVSVGMLSLGCPKTLVDSEWVLGLLDKNKYRVAEAVTDCDIALLNTCSFIQEAKQQSIDQILSLAELKKEGRIKALVVLGCLVQRYHKELEKELKEVDAFIGTGDYASLNSVLDQVVDKKRISLVGNRPGFLEPVFERVPLTPLHSRYIKISEGCDHVCTFCTIPLFRGKHRSRSLEDVVSEARRLVEFEGAKELVLTGQDTTFFGRDTERKFLLPELLCRLNEIKDLKWIRLLYAYPSYVTDALIDAVGSLEKVCHYVDMPLQHISDSMLSRMKRGTTKKSTYHLIEKIRKQIPDVAIRTTFIVGFPGEGEAEFKELLEFMDWAKFDRLGMFIYSKEDGSKAFEMDGQVSDSVMRKRFHEGMMLQQKISAANNQTTVGKTLPVLIEGKDENETDVFYGRSYMDAPEVDGMVYVKVPKGTSLKTGEFVRAKITGAKEYDLTASIEIPDRHSEGRRSEESQIVDPSAKKQPQDDGGDGQS